MHFFYQIWKNLLVVLYLINIETANLITKQVRTAFNTIQDII